MKALNLAIKVAIALLALLVLWILWGLAKKIFWLGVAAVAIYFVYKVVRATRRKR